MIWKLLEHLLRIEERVRTTWQEIRTEEEPEAVADDHGFGTSGYKGITGAGWAFTRDGLGRIIYVPGDLVDDYLEAEINDEAEEQDVPPLYYGPFSAEQMRAIVSFARIEPDPDIVLVWIAAHGGIHDDVP